MPTLLDKVVAMHMERLFKRKGQWTAVPNEDADNQRDAEPQILDVDDTAEIVADQGNSQAVTAAAAEVLTDVPLTDVSQTTTLLGNNGVSSDGQQAAETAQSVKKSKSLLGCLHFQKKEKEVAPNSGLPTAFNNRQSILRRLGRNAKKPAPEVVQKPIKPPKKNPYALHAAAWRTNMEQLLEQLANGADVARRDKAGLTALHYAAWQGSVDAVELLLEKGANVNVADPEGMLPIHFAAWFDRLDVAALLLDKGSMVNPPTKGLMWPTTPLIYAAKMGHKDMVGLLMDRGAKVEATYKAASSALHEASWGGHADVVAEMMSRNVSHDLSTSKSKYRALHLAAMSGSASVVDELLKHGAWVDARSQLGRTPLHLACEKGHVAAAAALVAGGADLLAKDRHGFTPLHLAVDNNHVQLAKLLLDKGATTDAQDSHGALPLNFAHDPDFFKLLRAVRWYGAASVPSGNNPHSSRYISTHTPTTGADAAMAAEASTAAETSDIKPPAAAAAKGAGSWIRAHMPSIRSAKGAAAAAAAKNPVSPALIAPQPLPLADVETATAALDAALVDPAATAVHTLAVSNLGNISPASSASSGESAAARRAAATMAREAVKAVVARAAAEAAADDALDAAEMGFAAQAVEPEIVPFGMEPRGSAPVSPSGVDIPEPVGAGGGFVSAERDSVDDARLLQQIRTALNGARGNLTAAEEALAATAEMEDDVKLEYFLRAPCSIGVDAPVMTTPSSKAPSPVSDDVHEHLNGDQAKHSTPAAASATPAPAVSTTPDIPLSTSADDGRADNHHGIDIVFTASPNSAAAKTTPPAAKPTAKSTAAAAAVAAKKSKSSSKRKSKSSSSVNGPARVAKAAV